IPLPLIALYQLMSHRITAGARELLSPDFLEARTLSLLGEQDWRVNWRTYLAAVHFNVPPGIALHVLNGGKIAQALESGDAQEVAARIAEEGFWSICDRVIWEHHTAWGAQPTLLANATRALEGPLAAVGAEQADNVWRELVGIAEAVEHWPPIDEPFSVGARLLMARMKTRGNPSYPVISERLIDAAADVRHLAGSSPDAVTSWYMGATAILRDVESDPRTAALASRLTAKLKNESWVNIQRTLWSHEADPAFMARFTPENEEEPDMVGRPKLGWDIAGELVTGGFAGDAVRFVQRMRDIYPQWPWSELIDEKLSW